VAEEEEGLVRRPVGLAADEKVEVAQGGGPARDALGARLARRLAEATLVKGEDADAGEDEALKDVVVARTAPNERGLSRAQIGVHMLHEAMRENETGLDVAAVR
jgi:hypothetical protein